MPSQSTAPRWFDRSQSAHIVSPHSLTLQQLDQSIALSPAPPFPPTACFRFASCCMLHHCQRSTVSQPPSAPLGVLPNATSTVDGISLSLLTPVWAASSSSPMYGGAGTRRKPMPSAHQFCPVHAMHACIADGVCMGSMSGLVSSCRNHACPPHDVTSIAVKAAPPPRPAISLELNANLPAEQR